MSFGVKDRLFNPVHPHILYPTLSYTRCCCWCWLVLRRAWLAGRRLVIHMPRSWGHPHTSIRISSLVSMSCIVRVVLCSYECTQTRHHLRLGRTPEGIRNSLFFFISKMPKVYKLIKVHERRNLLCDSDFFPSSRNGAVQQRPKNACCC